MTLKDSVQTAILIVGFFSLLVFGASYYFVLIDPDSSSYPLKESLSITASFFGGFATLTAAYIASKMYVDWKKPHDLNIETEHKKEILKLIRKIMPIEFKYDQLISSHFLYRDQPQRTMPIDINNEELSELTTYINELLGLLEELFFISKDKNIENMKKHYYNYAQLYTYILSRSNYLYKNESKDNLIDFGTVLNFV